MNYSEKYVEIKARKLRSKGVRRLKRTQVFFLRFGFVILLAGCLVGAFFGYRELKAIFDEVPDIRTVDLTPAGHTTQILDDGGNNLQVLVNKDIRSDYVMMDRLPDNLKNAFIAIEDPEFRSHEGIDPVGFLRALVTGLTNGGDFRQPTSTITEQLLRNQVFSGGEEKDLMSRFKRALIEQYMTLRMENRYTKDEILEYYLNTVSLGQNTQGVDAASMRYFNKHAEDLTLSECATLAAIVKNPTAYNPITHSTRNRNRELQVLTAMQDQGFISGTEYETAIRDDVQARVQRYNEHFMKNRKPTTYFVDALIQSVIEDLKSELGYTETQAVNALYSGGLKIYSTQDAQIQKIVDRETGNPKNYPEDVSFQPDYQLTVHPIGSQNNVSYSFNDVKKWYESQGKKLPATFSSEKELKKVINPFRRSIIADSDNLIAESVQLIVEPQISFVVMEQSTGAIKALVGGRGDKAASLSVNRATSSTRQPGSSLGTLAVYLPALDTSGMTLGTVQDDTEYNYPGTDQPVENLHPGTYRGLTTLRDSIIESIHVIAVKTMDQVTPLVSYDYLKRLGFTTLVDGYSDDAGKSSTDIALSTALGELNKGVNNLDLTGAYATIANGGCYHPPHLYTKITDHDGNTLIDHSNPESTRVMKETTAWLLTDVLRENVEDNQAGTIRFRNSDMVIAGREGASDENNDLWFTGYTPHLTAGIWCGYDSGKSQKDTDYHENIWRRIMEKISTRDETRTSFPIPDGIETVSICTKCGKLAIEDLCSDAVGGSCERTEYFTTDSVPTDTCDCHVRCRICKSSGLLAGDGCPESKVYEVVYLQKKDEKADDGKTMDSSLIIPDYLIDSICDEHNTK